MPNKRLGLSGQPGESDAVFAPRAQRERAAAAEDSSNIVPRATTITQIERNAFAQLFEQLAEQKPEEIVPNDLEDSRDEPSLLELDEEEGAWGPDFQVERILDEDLEFKESQADRYPPAIRHLAAKAEAQVARRTMAGRRAAGGKQKKDDDPVVAQRRAEVQRIEHRMVSARTDFGIWEVLEEDLFSKVRALDLDKEETIRSPSKRTGRKAATDRLSPRAKALAVPSPPSEPAHIALFGSAFPALLLLGTRLLCRRVSYTPLVPLVIPTIHSLGRSAAAWGMTTSLYNEVLVNQWRVRADLTYTLGVLREMDAGGFEMNQRTLDVLANITLHMYRAAQGELGDAVRRLKTMPSVQRQVREIGKWKARIKDDIEQRALRRQRRKEVERKAMQEGAFAEFDVEGETGAESVGAAM